MGPGIPVKISLYWITPSQMATDLDSLNLNCPYLQQTSKMIIQVSIFRNINFPMYPPTVHVQSWNHVSSQPTPHNKNTSFIIFPVFKQIIPKLVIRRVLKSWFYNLRFRFSDKSSRWLWQDLHLSKFEWLIYLILHWFVIHVWAEYSDGKNSRWENSDFKEYIYDTLICRILYSTARNSGNWY